MAKSRLGVVVDRKPRAVDDWDGMAADIAQAIGAPADVVEVTAMRCTEQGAAVTVQVYAPWVIVP